MNVAKRAGESIAMKLNFDFFYNRGHSFGEHYAHGIFNETMSANIDSFRVIFAG